MGTRATLSCLIAILIAICVAAPVAFARQQPTKATATPSGSLMLEILSELRGVRIGSRGATIVMHENGKNRAINIDYGDAVKIPSSSLGIPKSLGVTLPKSLSTGDIWLWVALLALAGALIRVASSVINSARRTVAHRRQKHARTAVAGR